MMINSYILAQIKQIMKVNVKSVLKTSDLQFEYFQEQQIIFQSGNMLCLKQINKSECRFIALRKEIDRLYCFKVPVNRKGVFTAQKHGDQLQICLYNMHGDRKAFNMSNQSLFFTQLEQVQLLIDEYDNSLVYGGAKNKQSSCVFLLDINKSKIIAIGYLPSFADIKVDGRQNMSISVLGFGNSFNYIKNLRYGLGQWEIDEVQYKKVPNVAIQHELLFAGRILIVTPIQLYIFEESNLLQTLNFSLEGKIVETIKIPKGIVVRFADNRLKLLIQDSDQTTYVDAGWIKIDLHQQDIYKIVVSQNYEELVLRTTRHNIYLWRCEHISSTTDRSELIFNKIQNSCNFSTEGSISISTGKKYCLLTSPTNATLWSLQKNAIVLSTDFTSQIEPKKRILFAGAINPDGNSVLLALDQKVRLYNILFTKLKQVAQFNIKRCQNILFSHGGQLAACRFGKGVNSCVTVINMLRSIEICTFKIQSEPRQIVWNELDDELIISTQSNTIQIFRISEGIKTHHIKMPSDISQVRIDYQTKKLTVSSMRQIFIIEGGKIIQKIEPPISNFHYYYPLYGAYFAATQTGELVWSHSPKFDTYQQIPLFSNKTFNLVCRNSYLVAFSSFQDITILHCERSNVNKKQNSDDIIMIERDEMLSFFDKIKVIEASYEILTSSSQVKIQQQKNRYQNAIIEHRQRYQRQIQYLNNKLSQLILQKSKQQRQNEHIFEKVQYGQLKNLKDLQKMYDRKFQIQKQRYLTLQQLYLQQKIKYEQMIINIQSKYHKEVGQVRQEYESKTKDHYNKIQQIKNMNLDDKIKMEMRFIDLEEENDLTTVEMQNNNENYIHNLRIKYTKLQQDYEQTNILLHNVQDDLQRVTQQLTQKAAEVDELKEKLRSFQSRVLLLDKEIARKDMMIEQRNQIIDEQSQQIGGLQKAKYVLSFRTTQIRKQLEPKQEQVDKLKSQMYKLEQQFKQERKKNHNLNSRLQKYERINEIDKRQISDLKINLKYKQRLYEELCSEIFTVVNNVDPKQWNAQIIKIYQNYIKQSKYEKRGNNKKDDTTQEINRHLIHVQESLMQVTSGTEKVLKAKEKEVMRKMKENSQLVYELNVMRKKENQFIKQRRQLSYENARLKRQLNQSVKSTTRTQTAFTGFTRRVVASRQGHRQKSLNLDIRQLQKTKTQMKSSRVEKNRLVSARRTLLIQDDKKKNQTKVFDIARQLQTARSTIKRQDRIIEQLNQRLLGGVLE